MIERHSSKRFRRALSSAARGLAALALVVGILGVTEAEAGGLTPHDMALLDRLDWGIKTSRAAHLQAIGADRWLAEQLHPGANAALPAAAEAQIEAMPDVHKLPFDIA